MIFEGKDGFRVHTGLLQQSPWAHLPCGAGAPKISYFQLESFCLLIVIAELT